ncbi:MaoC/PaaZ C-terminal domain-containing protein [Mycobacteroides abscessus]|uniref:MaoC/PaaZ C-terminal domain-containing protein n=1 Tax=Mycobacteroides abscessus TaxID=36809 RepID=UPI000C25D360|nr:MaoC/PaaZ C-terminal domain-containing protein [Mycobacteroides abscessus]
MPINVDIALGAATEPAEFSWTASDVQLYHLAIGAGADPVSETELRYLQDKTPQVLPTFATVASGFHAVEPPKVSFPGIEIDLAKILHGTEQVTAHRPLPPSGTARSEGKVVEIWDKGKAAVIVTETTTSDDQGPLWTIRRSIFARGEGGFGGERGPSSHGGVPERDADLEVSTHILPQQALLYRLCGDRNPLHSDPAFAAAAGFPRPILHGLCSYGVVCKAAVDAALDGEVSRVTSYAAKFAGVVFPGETLKTRIWKEDGKLLISAVVADREDAPALADVELTHS